MSDRSLFINIPVADVAKSRAFFSALGFGFNDQFSSDDTACLIVSPLAYFMLLEHPKFAGFAPTDAIGDPRQATSHLLTFSAASREEVDSIVETAIAQGGAAAGEDQDHGFMYGRGFTDLDGHYWSTMWMDPAVAGDDAPAE